MNSVFFICISLVRRAKWHTAGKWCCVGKAPGLECSELLNKLFPPTTRSLNQDFLRTECKQKKKKNQSMCPHGTGAGKINGHKVAREHQAFNEPSKILCTPSIAASPHCGPFFPMKEEVRTAIGLGKHREPPACYHLPKGHRLTGGGHWPSKLEPRLPLATSHWSRRVHSSVQAQPGPGKYPVVDCEACPHLIGNRRLGPYTGCKNPRW